MIKNYNLFLLKENVKLSSDDIIDIVKSLSTDNKNSKLVSKLVNYVDEQGKTILMDLVQKNKIDLIDYILKFNIDINHKNKKNENVLFYCKNINMFNRFYNMGADVTLINSDERNILLVLSNKKIFNVDLYKKLINNGVDINKKDRWNNSIIFFSIYNQKILELLISENVKFDNINSLLIINELVHRLRWWNKDKKMVINKIKYLFENGLKISEEEFLKAIKDQLLWMTSSDKFDIVKDFIMPLSKYIDDDMIKKLIIDNTNNVNFLIKVMENLPHYYTYIKQLWRSSLDSFNYHFGEFLKKHPYLEAADKYNL
jgi:hypothetical protein